jgi:hypothetical protein
MFPILLSVEQILTLVDAFDDVVQGERHDQNTPA